MTVADNTSRNQYTATSGQTVFAYTFEIVDKGDIVVLQNGTTLSEGTNYTVSNVGNDSGGNVTLTVGATTGDILTLYRDMPYARTQNYTNSGDFLASEVNSDFDNLWLAGEQTQRSFSQSIRKPITDSDSISMELPAAASRTNSFLTFDSTGAVSTSPLAGANAPTSITRQQFTGNGSTTVFTLAADPGSAAAVVIYIDGVYQEEGTYSISGSTLTFTEAPPTNASIEVLLYRVTNIGTTTASAVSITDAGNYYTSSDVEGALQETAQSQNIVYTPAGTGAVQTTVQTKLRESVSVKDFGAVGDYDTGTSTGTNNFTAFTNAIASTDGLIEIPTGNYRNGGTGGSTRVYAGDGIVYTGAGSTINNKYQRIGNIGGSPDKNHFSIGCIPRCTAGVFSLLDDAFHTPMNVSSVSQPDAFSIRINYLRTASKINTFIVTPDDALAPYGVVCGGDVGTSYANIITAAPFSGEISKSGGTPSLALNDLWAGGISGGNISITASDASICRITHTPSVSNDPPIVSLKEPSFGLSPEISFYDASTIDVIMLGDAAGYISYNGSSWGQLLSDNLTAPTLTWTASNTLKVDHNISNSTNRVPILTGHNGVYLPQVVNIGTDFFEVAFYDYSGTKVTTQSTDMKFWYRRDLKVPCTWVDGVDVVVRRGLVKVPSALYSGVAGNNFWVYGDMEV